MRCHGHNKLVGRHPAPGMVLTRLLCLVLGASVTAQGPARTAEERARKIIYGDDNRMSEHHSDYDPSTSISAAMRAVGSASTVALIPEGGLVYDRAANTFSGRTGARSFGESRTLCDSAGAAGNLEQFGAQPNPSSCSGTVVQWDEVHGTGLVATAGHCLDQDGWGWGGCQAPDGSELRRCPFMFAFDFTDLSVTGEGNFSLPGANVYACSGVSLCHVTEWNPGEDYALLRITRQTDALSAVNPTGWPICGPPDGNGRGVWEGDGICDVDGVNCEYDEMDCCSTSGGTCHGDYVSAGATVDRTALDGGAPRQVAAAALKRMDLLHGPVCAGDTPITSADVEAVCPAEVATCRSTAACSNDLDAALLADEVPVNPSAPLGAIVDCYMESERSRQFRPCVLAQSDPNSVLTLAPACSDAEISTITTSATALVVDGDYYVEDVPLQFPFNSTAGSMMTFRTELYSLADSYIELYSSTGEMLAYDDDGGDGLASYLEWTCPSDGTYSLNVRAYSDGNQFGDSMLTVTGVASVLSDSCMTCLGSLDTVEDQCEPNSGTGVTAIGHPSGLPRKYMGDATVQNIEVYGPVHNVNTMDTMMMDTMMPPTAAGGYGRRLQGMTAGGGSAAGDWTAAGGGAMLPPLGEVCPCICSAGTVVADRCHDGRAPPCEQTCGEVAAFHAQTPDPNGHGCDNVMWHYTNTAGCCTGSPPIWASYEADLDTEDGNSGSGVFEDATGLMVGILLSGGTDFIHTSDAAGEVCTRAFRCNYGDQTLCNVYLEDGWMADGQVVAVPPECWTDPYSAACVSQCHGPGMELAHCTGETFVNLAPLMATIEMAEECAAMPASDVGHVDFCKCHPDLCTAGVGHCDADSQCADSLRCMGSDFCDASNGAMLVNYETSRGCQGSTLEQGPVTMMRWDGIDGSSVQDLLIDPRYPGQPDFVEHMWNFFESPTNVCDHCATLLHGFFKAPMDGEYVFRLAADDGAELMLGRTGTDPVAIAHVPGWTSSRQWYKYNEQTSTPQTLAADEYYELTAIAKEQGGGDNLAVGVTFPDGMEQNPLSAWPYIHQETECQPSCCGMQCWEMDSEDACAAHGCEWEGWHDPWMMIGGTTGPSGWCRPAARECSTVTSERECLDQFGECYYDHTQQVCVENAEVCGMCMEVFQWTAVNGTCVDGTGAVVAGVTEEAVCHLSSDSWVLPDETTCTGASDMSTGDWDNWYSNEWQACTMEMLNNDWCDMACDHASCPVNSAGLTDNGNCWQCADWCWPDQLGNGWCDEDCNVGSCNHDAACRVGTEGDLWARERLSDFSTAAECTMANHTWVDDCAGIAPPCNPHEGYCPDEWIGDGICDSGCNIDECQNDLGDCLYVPPLEEVVPLGPFFTPLPDFGWQPEFWVWDTCAAEIEVCDEQCWEDLSTGTVGGDVTECAACETACLSTTFTCGTGGPGTDFPSTDDYNYCADNTICPCGDCCYCSCDVIAPDAVGSGGNRRRMQQTAPPPTAALNGTQSSAQQCLASCSAAGGPCDALTASTATGGALVCPGCVAPAQEVLQCHNMHTTADPCTDGVTGSIPSHIELLGYENNQGCTWDLQCDSPDAIVQVNFYHFYVENGRDYLHFDSPAFSESGEALDGQSWDGMHSGMVSSDGPTLSLRFESDGSVIRDGFQAMVTCVETSTEPALDSCSADQMVNITGRTSGSFDGSTVGAPTSYVPQCGGAPEGPEMIFTYELPAGYAIDFYQSHNNYDSRHETRVGGACPGDAAVDCTDDPDTRPHFYHNGGAEAVPVYFIMDAWTNGAGEFALNWNVTNNQEVQSECAPMLAGLANGNLLPICQTTDECGAGLFCATDCYVGECDGVVEAAVVDQIQLISFGLTEHSTAGCNYTTSTDAGGQDPIGDALAAFTACQTETASSDHSASYCSVQLTAASGLANQEACGGSNLDIGFHTIVPLAASCESIYHFRFHVDYGRGSFVGIDQMVAQPGDTWGHVLLMDQYLTLGEHRFEAIGFEGCCDGHSELELKLPRQDGGFSDWTHVTAGFQPSYEGSCPWSECAMNCRASGFCCNDFRVGSNQLISCAQACMMRERGTIEDACHAQCDDRNNNRACETVEQGHSYSHCGTCADMDDTCPHGVQNEDACHMGCNVGSPSGPAQNHGTCQPCAACDPGMAPWMSMSGSCDSCDSFSEDERLLLHECLSTAMPIESFQEQAGAFANVYVYDMTPVGGGDATGGGDGAVPTGWTDDVMPLPTWLTDSEIVLEVGTVSTDSSDVDISFQGSFDDPVIIAGVPSHHGNGQLVVRIRSIDTHSFSMYLDAPDCLDDPSNFETFSYLIINAGAFGPVQAGKITSSTDFSWDDAAYHYALVDPVVVSQIQTHTGGDWVKTRHRNVDNDGFQVKLEEDGLDDSHNAEVIGWLAANSGVGNVGPMWFEAVATANAVTHDAHEVFFSTPFFAPPGLFGSIATFAGNNPSHLRQSSILNTIAASIFVEEETCSDAELTHMSEVVHLLAFDVGVGGGLEYLPAACPRQSNPTCTEASALMVVNTTAVALDLWVDAGDLSGRSVPQMFSFMATAGTTYVVETEAVAGMDTYLLLFAAECDMTDLSTAPGGGITISGGTQTCETAGYASAATSAQCEALALSIGEAFNGNAGGDMPGCMRWQDGATAAAGWSFSGSGAGSGAVCAGDDANRGYECLCELSGEVQTAEAAAAPVCGLIEDFNDDWGGLNSRLEVLVPHDRRVFFAVHHYPGWSIPREDSDFRVRVQSPADVCAESATDPVLAWACTDDATCVAAGHNWILLTGADDAAMTMAIHGWCEPLVSCEEREFSCADGQCIPEAYFCDGDVNLGNADWGPDCGDGSDEGLAICAGRPAYSCNSGFGCDRCSSAEQCAAAECLWTASSESCNRLTGVVDPRCTIPGEVFEQCSSATAYCAGLCAEAMLSWYDPLLHSAGGECGATYQAQGIPAADLAFIRTKFTQCEQHIGCPGVEMQLTLLDSFGDGWNGHQISVRHNGNITWAGTLAEGSEEIVPLCIFPDAAGQVGCLVVEVDSSEECATRTGTGCWSEEVMWGLRTVEAATGEDVVRVEEGLTGDSWDNEHASCAVGVGTDTITNAEVLAPAAASGACGAEEVQCTTDDRCIPASYLCDGLEALGNAGWPADCDDGSDELWAHCLATGASAYASPDASCSAGEPSFTCYNGGPLAGGLCMAIGCEACAICEGTDECLLETAQCLTAGCSWSSGSCVTPSVTPGVAPGGGITISGGTQTCETAGYASAATSAQCEALALSIGEAFNGNAGGDMPGCMRWQDGATAAAGWSFSGSGAGSGAVCAGDDANRGYECLCELGGATPAPTALSVQCAALTLPSSCVAVTDFCTDECAAAFSGWYGSAWSTCRSEFEALGASPAWVTAVEALAQACSTPGCAGAAGKVQYKFELRDTWGDGWNGNTYTIRTKDSAGLVQDHSTGTLQEGYGADVMLCLDAASMSCMDITVNSDGTYKDEVYWRVVNVADNTTMTRSERMTANTQWLEPADCTGMPEPALSFTCDNEELIAWAALCDGQPDCRGGEDETLSAFCAVKSTCTVLEPRSVGNGVCDGFDSVYNSQSCGRDGGDCYCEQQWRLIQSDCAFTEASGLGAPLDPTTGVYDCHQGTTCGAGRSDVIQGVQVDVLPFGTFMDTCGLVLFDEPSRRSLTSFAATCAGGFTCQNGDVIPSTHECDGFKHCPDGTDEGFTKCANDYNYGQDGRTFRCIDATIIEDTLECNGVCNCLTLATGMCEDEHRAPDDATCAPHNCARQLTDGVALCGGTLPSSTCSRSCADAIVDLQNDCTQYIPAADATLFDEAVVVCSFVQEHMEQPALVCTNSSGGMNASQGEQVALTHAQVCDQIPDCDSGADEAHHSPVCPYLQQTGCAAGTMEDCSGKLCVNVTLTTNGVCDEVLNCELYDFDQQECKVTVEVDTVMTVGGDINCAALAAGLAEASNFTIPVAQIECPQLQQTVTSTLVLGGVTGSVVDGNTPGGQAALADIENGVQTVLGTGVTVGVTLTEAKGEGRRRMQNGNAPTVTVCVLSDKAVASTIGSDAYNTQVTLAINTGGSPLTLGATSLTSTVDTVNTDVSVVVHVDSYGASAAGVTTTSTAAVSANLEASLQSTLSATDSLANAINANGGHVSRVTTGAQIVHSTASAIVLGQDAGGSLITGALVCDPNRFDTNGNTTDGCEAGCPTVRSATCTSCSDPNTCTSLVCETNRFDSNANTEDGCEVGCALVAQGHCTACSDASTCTTLQCAAGFVDFDGSSSNGCEAPTPCDGSGTMCGCGVDEQIVAAGSVTQATLACSACPSGYHFDGGDRVPSLSVRPCVANQCTVPAQQQGFVLTGVTCSGTRTGSIACTAPSCSSEYTGTPSDADHTCDMHNADLVFGGCRFVTVCDGSNSACVCDADNEVVADATTGFLSCTACPVGYTRRADSSPVVSAVSCTMMVCDGMSSDCGCPAEHEVVTDDSGLLSCQPCGVGYSRLADAAPVSSTRQCLLTACDGTSSTCGCGTSNDAAFASAMGLLSCVTCQAGKQRAADTTPVSSADECTTVRCDGSNSQCGCDLDEEVVADAATGFLSCTTCAPGNTRPADADPVNVASQCLLRVCDGTASACACLVADQEVVADGNGLLSCQPCGAGYIRAADAAPVSSATTCVVFTCDGSFNSRVCGCEQNEAVTGSFNLNCAPCAVGFERLADTTPVASSQACLASTCASMRSANSDKDTTDSIAGATGDTVDVVCDAGFSGGGPFSCGTDSQFTGPPCTVNLCVLPTTLQPGYVLPVTCTGENVDQPFAVADLAVTNTARFSVAGVFLCESPPSCGAGYGGMVTYACDANGAELTLAGCAQLPCSQVTCSAGTVLVGDGTQWQTADSSSCCADDCGTWVASGQTCNAGTHPKAADLSTIAGSSASACCAADVSYLCASNTATGVSGEITAVGDVVCTVGTHPLPAGTIGRTSVACCIADQTSLCTRNTVTGLLGERPAVPDVVCTDGIYTAKAMGTIGRSIADCCDDTDSCLPRYGFAGCGSNAACTDVPAPAGGYACTCNAGYGGNLELNAQATCTALPCTANPLIGNMNGASTDCVGTPSGGSCTFMCKPGYTPSGPAMCLFGSYDQASCVQQYGWVAAAFAGCGTTCGTVATTLTRVVTCRGLGDDTVADNAAQCTAAMPALTAQCAAVLEGDSCDDGDAQTMDDVCDSSLTPQGCKGKKKLASSLTFNISPNLPTGSALVALKDTIATATATTLATTMSSVTPSDVVVNSIVAGSTVVGYVVAALASEATADNQAAAVTALGSSNDLASVDIGGSQAGTATPEVFIVYSWVKTDAVCPMDCGLSATTLSDTYMCQADGDLALDSACVTNIGVKPSTTVACLATAACVTYSWFADPFAACPATCGRQASATLNRAVICLSSDGSTAPGLAEVFCDGMKPSETTDCAATDICVAYEWVTEVNWSPLACSAATCGTAEVTQTRDVSCYAKSWWTGGTEALTLVEDAWATVRCADARPASVAVCAATPDCAAFSWTVVGDWSGACPTACGSSTATLTRSVVCFDEIAQGEASSEASCTDAKPSPQQVCAPTDVCAPLPGAVTVSLSLGMDIASIAVGTPERIDFEDSFRADVAAALGINADRVLLLSIVDGSVVVTFAVNPAPGGFAITPTQLEHVFAETLSIAGAHTETFTVQTFSWSTGDWSSSCPTACGSSASMQTRAVVCQDDIVQAEAPSETSCEETKPSAQQFCAATDACAPMPGAVTVSLSLDMDFASIAVGTPERIDFEDSFRADVAAALGINADRVLLLSIVDGSVVVTFAVNPSPAGVAIAAAELDYAFSATGLSIAGANAVSYSTVTVDEAEDAEAISMDEMMLMLIVAAAGLAACLCVTLAVVCCLHTQKAPPQPKVVTPGAARYAIDDDDENPRLVPRAASGTNPLLAPAGARIAMAQRLPVGAQPIGVATPVLLPPVRVPGQQEQTPRQGGKVAY